MSQVNSPEPEMPASTSDSAEKLVLAVEIDPQEAVAAAKAAVSASQGVSSEVKGEPSPQAPVASGPLTICAVRPHEPCDTADMIGEEAEQLSPIDEFIRTTKLLSILGGSQLKAASAEVAGAEPSVAQAQPVSMMDLEAISAIEETPGSDDASQPPSDISPPPISEQAGPTPATALPEVTQAIPPTKEVDSQLNNLLLLGLVSAVESYLRSLVSRLVNVDSYVLGKVDELKVSFVAARLHHEHMLAEALMEDMTFISKTAINNLFSQLLGITPVQARTHLDDALSEYDRICQLRHCIVHRFGKLGSKNALQLGIDVHGQNLEKPIQLTQENLQLVAFNLSMIVKSINNYVYDCILKRQAFSSESWTWNEGTDMDRFKRIYEVFATTLDTTPSLSQAASYTQFSNAYKAKSASVKAEHQRRRKEKEKDSSSTETPAN